MNDTLKGLLRILKEGDQALKCPVTQVLGALAPKDPLVVKALVVELQDADQYLSNFILEALGAIGTGPALDALIDVLEHTETQQDWVVLALSRAGEAGEECVVRCWERCDRETRMQLLQVLIRTQGPMAVDKLCKVLRSPEWSLGLQVVELLRERITSFPDAQVKKFRAKLGAYLRGNLAKADPVVVAGHLDLFTQVGGPSLNKTLSKYAQPQWNPSIRRVAITGFSHVELTPAEVTKLFAYLYEQDYTNVVGPTLDLLKKLDIPVRSQPKLLSLVDPEVSLHPQIRSFAMEALSAFKDKAAAKALLGYLDHPEEWAHTRASVGLEGNLEARSDLQSRLLKASGEGELNLVLRPLQTIGESLKPAFLRKAFNHMEGLRAAGNPVWTRIRDFLWAVNPDFVVKEGLTQARKLRQDNSYDQVLDLLLTIAAGRDPEPALRYEIAMAQILRTHRSVTEPPTADPAMGHIQRLVEESQLDVLSSIVKEEHLKPDDLLYIGTHFLGRAPALEDFGAKVLHLLLKKWPHSKSAKLANQKFKSTGIEPRG